MSRRVMELFVPNRADSVGIAVELTQSFLSHLSVAADFISDAQTVVSEAVCNAVDHAYPASKYGKCRIVFKLTLSDDSLRISVQDWGVGIADIDQARQPLYTTGGSDHAGMGFTIMETFSDTLHVGAVRGRGTRVVINMRLRATNK